MMQVSDTAELAIAGIADFELTDAQFHRIRARRGAKKAILAVAASMLTAAWHMLRNQTDWRDLGAAHFDRADAAKTANRFVTPMPVGYKR